MDAVSPKLERLGPEQSGKIERSVEMGEECAAARRLPFELRPKPRRIERKQHESVLLREILGQGSFELIGGRKMDEAVAAIVGRAGKMPAAHRLAEGGLGQDLVDGICHRLREGL